MAWPDLDKPMLTYIGVDMTHACAVEGVVRMARVIGTHEIREIAPMLLERENSLGLATELVCRNFVYFLSGIGFGEGPAPGGTADFVRANRGCEFAFDETSRSSRNDGYLLFRDVREVVARARAPMFIYMFAQHGWEFVDLTDEDVITGRSPPYTKLRDIITVRKPSPAAQKQSNVLRPGPRALRFD